MSKKQKAISAQTENEISKKQDEISKGVVTTKANDKGAKDKDKKKKDKKKPKENKEGVVQKTKATMSELKKVTWPTFGEVVKKTGIVIAFVLIFGVFLYGVNTLLGWLASLLA